MGAGPAARGRLDGRSAPGRSARPRRRRPGWPAPANLRPAPAARSQVTARCPAASRRGTGCPSSHARPPQPGRRSDAGHSTATARASAPSARSTAVDVIRRASATTATITSPRVTATSAPQRGRPPSRGIAAVAGVDVELMGPRPEPDRGGPVPKTASTATAPDGARRTTRPRRNRTVAGRADEHTDEDEEPHDEGQGHHRAIGTACDGRAPAVRRKGKCSDPLAKAAPPTSRMAQPTRTTRAPVRRRSGASPPSPTSPDPRARCRAGRRQRQPEPDVRGRSVEFVHEQGHQFVAVAVTPGRRVPAQEAVSSSGPRSSRHPEGQAESTGTHVGDPPEVGDRRGQRRRPAAVIR